MAFKNSTARLRYIGRKHGMKNSLTIIQEAKRAGLPVALAFALIEQESGNGSNVFGHDPTIFAGAGTVTHAKYLAYKRARGRTRMQGVGPAQLTWWELQDEADRKGGCWRPRYNMRVAFEHLRSLIRSHGKWAGIKAYNGSGVAATNYANSVQARERKWAARFK